MPLVIVLAAMLLASCGLGDGKSAAAPATKTESQSQATAPALAAAATPAAPPARPDANPAPQQLRPELATPAVEVITAALKDPALRGDALDLVAMLPPASAALCRDAVLELLADRSELDRHELAAWLAVDPAPARERLAAGLAEAQPECVMALVYHAAVGRELLATLKPAPEQSELSNLCLDLLRSWGAAKPADAVWLRELLKSTDPTVRYRAAGHLLALGAEDAELFELLSQAVHERGPGWIGAIEGIKISGDARFADELVPLVSQAQMARRLPADAAVPQVTESSAVLLGCYALAYLPGEQAALMRRKLLSAASPTVVWQARLGELMHGNAVPWHQAIAEGGIEDEELWLVLEPPEARHPDLLPLYAAAGYSGYEQIQQRAALQLNRYNGSASEGKLARILSQLAASASPRVKWRAWLSAGAVRSCRVARLAVDNLALGTGTDSARLAQAFCVLCCVAPADAGPTPGAEGSDD